MAARVRGKLRAVLRAPLLLVPIGILCLAAGVARAQPAPTAPPLPLPAEEVVETRSATWPLALDFHALLGVEPHDRGNPTAFGAGAELLWRGRVGGFADVFSSEGTALIAPTVNGVMQPGFADRISVPFGLVVRPLAHWVVDRSSWAARLGEGVGLQIGATIEHLRTSDDSTTTGGLHLGLAVDVPIYGGTKEGGVALRLYARAILTPSVQLDNKAVSEPSASAQLFAGLVYYP